MTQGQKGEGAFLTTHCMRSRGAVWSAALALLVSCGPGAEQKAAAPEAVSAAPVESDDPATRVRRPEGHFRPVIWLGLDGLDWELLDRLSREGRMPNWKRLVAEGASANLTSFMPILSPIVWTTAATGVGPDIHRVLDFQEVDPKTGEKVPISGRSRAVPAVWNLASVAGRTVGVVGWWATHPAEEVNGFFVSDRANPILSDRATSAGAGYPPSVAAGMAQVVERDGRVTDEDIGRFVSVPVREIAQARASGGGMENPIVGMERILSATRVYQRIARDLYDRGHPDLMALYLEGTDQIGHVFASYTPPRLRCVSDAEVARYGGAAEAYFALIDRILGQWMRRAEEDHATLLVHSDHGFKWGSDRSCERASWNWATAAFWHRLEGVFVAWGGATRARTARGQASVFDVAPTVLALLGLPADRRMSGHALTGFFRDLPELARRDLMGVVPVRRVVSEAVSDKEATEYAKKLMALGYLSASDARPLAPTGGDRPGMTEGAWNNLGLYYSETGHALRLAREAFLEALKLRPSYHSPMFNLAVLDRRRGETASALDWLFRALETGHPDPQGTILQWAAEYERTGKPDAAKALLDRAVAAYPGSEAIAREEGLNRFRSRDCAGAVKSLSRFAATTSDPVTLSTLGLFETCLGRRNEAIRYFEKSLTVKPDQPNVTQALRLVRANPPEASPKD
jgi:predicted AlkP superfamily phosphohydrolase/phosphomutase/Flp pilus assembly protein TadD